MKKIITFYFVLLTISLNAMPFAFQEPVYSFQSLRAIAASSVGAADIGECLVTNSAITEGDDESWYTQWLQLAQRIEKEGQQWKTQGDLESTRSAFRRASNYYRTAEFFLHTNPKDPRILTTWRKSKECFLNAMEPAVKQVRIPFEGTTLPGYLCLADGEGNRPLIIVQTGFDGTAEELYFVFAQAAVKRGYHCLIFEGPGQGGVIREQGIPFRTNWETVITPVVDYAYTIPQVEKERIALVGFSFGGYLVPRALAFEPRIKIGIVNGGVYDFHHVCMRNQPPELEQELDDPEAAKAIDNFILNAMKTNVLLRWVFGNGMYTFHAKTPSEWLRMTRAYQLKDVIGQIKCKMLVISSDHDFQMEGQSKAFYEAFQGPKEWMLFTEKEGAGEHCQVGAYTLSNERILNWLNNQL